MLQETFYGNDGFCIRNDGDAGNKSLLPTFSTLESPQVVEASKEETDTSFTNQNNRRLDKYHLYFSSWL